MKNSLFQEEIYVMENFFFQVEIYVMQNFFFQVEIYVMKNFSLSTIFCYITKDLMSSISVENIASDT